MRARAFETLVVGQLIMREDRADTVDELTGDESETPDRPALGWYCRGYLPHFDADVITQTATFRLADSVPRDLLNRWQWELRRVTPSDAETALFHRIERCLDSGLGACHLRDPRIGGVVRDALLFFDGKRYALHAWVIMPNHVHTLFTPFEGERLDRILHSWKSFTARKANRILRRDGPFWQRDYYDRYVRDESHFMSIARYIEDNPVAAGLCERREEWEFSSARQRFEDGEEGSKLNEPR